MLELWQQFAALTPAVQATVIAAVAGGIVWLLRSLGLKTAPGLASVLAAALVGAAAGYAAQGTWQGALLGAIAGLAATGAHQASKQTTLALKGEG